MHVTHYTNSSSCEEELLANVVCVDVFERRNAPNTSVVKTRCTAAKYYVTTRTSHKYCSIAAGTQYYCLSTAMHGIR